MLKRLVVSNYNNDLAWLSVVLEHGIKPENILIYDRSDRPVQANYPGTLIRSPNTGYNIYDILRHIDEYYDDLGEITYFVKGNLLSRPDPHATMEKFLFAIRHDIFFPIERDHPDWVEYPKRIMSCDGGYLELNNAPPSVGKYFSTYNEFLVAVFENPIIPQYIRFPPGGNFAVPRANIVKYPRSFYQRLRNYVSYCQLPVEAHYIERGLYTIWTADFKERSQELSPQQIKDHPLLKHKIARNQVFPFEYVVNTFNRFKGLFKHEKR